MRKSTLSILISGLLFTPDIYAVDSYLIHNPDNSPLFEIRFFDVEDGVYAEDGDETLSSTWNLNQLQKDKIVNAMRYWAEIIKPAPGAFPAIINTGTYDEVNAFGLSEPITDGDTKITLLQATLNGISFSESDLNSGSHALFTMGRMGWDSDPSMPSQLPYTGKVNLFSTAIHELAHGLGISSFIKDINGEGSNTPAFESDQPLNVFSMLLRDDNGNLARPGQRILCEGCDNPDDPQGFDVRKDSAYLTGKNIDAVLAGAMRGVPVKILDDENNIDDDYMSHLELKNSLMSHQEYRNYTTFIEAELAVLQDMGYQIDRRNFFGYSVYGDGNRLINKNGYSLRNAAGDGYIAGKYNTATLGLGLHVYGSNNQIFQQADLLTQGAGGAGIRVDGENNQINIEKNTRVYADGINGRGVMFAWGKNHHLVQRGDVQAMGTDGIALSFDFGNNALSNEVDYRGSWIHKVKDEIAPLLPELEGALVDKVDISGRVAGKYAALYLSQNALVNEINILNGANISGDIYSHYNQQDEDGNQRLTRLSFGRLADSQGQATNQSDSAFSLAYQGKIEGIDNLALSAEGGQTRLNGSHKIYSMHIAPQATLSGNSDYLLHPEGSFVNEGLLAPGNALGQMVITGDYQQGESGQLQLEFDGHGGHDTLIINGHARYDGELWFVPRQDWYATHWKLDSQDLLKANLHSGSFSEVNALLNSPTLRLQIDEQQNASWQLSMTRASNAYSQYAHDRNARQAGQALDRIVTVARPDIQPLFRALDFSSPDGSGVRSALNQLTPAAYSALLAGSLNRERQITDILNAPALFTMKNEDEWQSFAVPFGGGYWQQRQENSVGYRSNSFGVVFGAQKQSSRDGNLRVGFHGAASRQTTTVKAPQNGSGRTSAFDLGVQAYYAADPQQGAYFFGHGRAGIEDSSMNRSVRLSDYRVNHHASWTGWSGAITGGGGYQYALNENVNVGPMASLSYTALHRPEIKEKTAKGSGLKLESGTYHSLRSSVGVKTSWHKPLSSGSVLTAQLQLSWDRELLDTEHTQRASFVDYRDVSFNSKNKVTGRDSLGLKSGIRYQFSSNMETGAGVSSDLFRSGYRAVSGNVSASWRF